MRGLREELWMCQAKPFGYELLDIKLGGVEARLKSHIRRIESYVTGDIHRLEELEQERLPYWHPSRVKRKFVEQDCQRLQSDRYSLAHRGIRLSREKPVPKNTLTYPYLLLHIISLYLQYFTLFLANISNAIV